MVKSTINSILKEQDFKTWWVLHQTSDVVTLIRSRELSQHDITTEQAAVLLIVKKLNDMKRKCTPGEISKWILREPHSVSKILTRMDKEGYVSKTGGLGKKRNEVHILLTEKGEQAYRCSLKRDSIREVMSCLSKEECMQLNSLLVKLRDKALQDMTKRSQAFFP